MAKDLIHYHVRRALEKDGWTIVAAPFFLRLSSKTNMEFDLQAEKFMSAKKEMNKFSLK